MFRVNLTVVQEVQRDIIPVITHCCLATNQGAGYHTFKHHKIDTFVL